MKFYNVRPLYQFAYALLIAAAVFASPLFSVTPVSSQGIILPPFFINEEVANGLTQPLSLQFAPDGRLFVTERTGTLRIIQDGILRATPFLTLSVSTEGSHGLVGVSFDPNFNRNGHVYVLYHRASDGRARVSRFTTSPTNRDLADPDSEMVIYDDLPSDPTDRLREIPFGPDGKMYIGGTNTQVRRIDPVNAPNVIPSDNPTPDSAIWAEGFRAPTSLVFDPVFGTLYANDAGWNAPENIWLVTKGRRSLVHSYDHVEGGGAVTGGAFYHAEVFPEEFRGSYFFVDHVQGFIKRIDTANLVQDFASTIPFPVDLKVGPDGFLYYTRLGVLADLGPEFGNPQPNGSVHRIRFMRVRS